MPVCVCVRARTLSLSLSCSLARSLSLSIFSGLEDGCALFWRTDTVTLQNVETMNYNAYTEDGSLSGEKANQVAILATLQVGLGVWV